MTCAQDVWSGKTLADDEGDAEMDDEDEPRGEVPGPRGEVPGDDAEKTMTPSKQKKGKKEKRDKTDKKDKKGTVIGKRNMKDASNGPSWKRARALVSPPQCMNPAVGESKEQEPLFHNGYHGLVYKQIWAEWGARACVLYTPGNGEAAIQAVQSEFPLLCLGANSVHAEVLVWFIDCAVANAIQVHWAGNRLHDVELRGKILDAFGDAADADVEPEKDRKKDEKTKKAKKHSMKDSKAKKSKKAMKNSKKYSKKSTSSEEEAESEESPTFASDDSE